MKKLFILSILIIFIFGSFNMILAKKEKSSFSIEVKKISPSTKEVLKINQKIYVWFSYKVPDDYNKGVYIWVIPKKTKKVIIQASPLIFSKNGTITRYFSIKKGRVKIRKLYVRMMDRKQTKVLAQEIIKVNYTGHPKSLSYKDRKVRKRY